MAAMPSVFLYLDSGLAVLYDQRELSCEAVAHILGDNVLHGLARVEHRRDAIVREHVGLDLAEDVMRR